jgi:HK97 family phage prohead protease
MDKLELPVQHFSAHFSADSANAENRTMDLTWQTGAQMDRYGWDGKYTLQLSMDPKHVRMGRLQGGTAPLLANHSSYALDDVLGVIENASLQGDTGKATVRFDDSPEADKVFKKVQNKILRNTSVGTRIHKLKDVTAENAKTKSYLAVDWEPFEISVVPIGADPGAQFSADKQGIQVFSCEIEPLGAEISKSRATAHEREQTMEETTVQAGAAAGTTPVDPKVIAEEARREERLRCETIRKNCRAAGMTEEFAAGLIENGSSIKKAGQDIFAAMEKRGESSQTTSAHTAQVTRDQKVERCAAAVSALLHRYSPQQFKLREDAADFRGMSLLRLAEEFVKERGINPRGMSRDQLASIALERPQNFANDGGGWQGVTDFPGVLADVSNKTLRQAYQQTTRTFVGVFRQVTNTDFKNVNRMQLGEAPQLVAIGPSGGFTHGSVTDSKATYKLATYGRIVGLSRQTIINDDLDAFSRVPAGFGMQAANLESDTVWGIVTANGNMADGNALFSTAHKNYIASGAAPDVTNVAAARKLLRQMKGLDAKTLLNILGKNLVAPSSLETNLEQLVTTQIVPTQISNAVPQWFRSLNPVIEPRLDASSLTAWYLFADNTQIDTVEYAYLEGQEGVYIETRMGFDVDGLEIKARLDFGAAAIDYRGMVKNNGA